MSENSVKSFEENMSRLEKIVDLLEKGGAPLAESLALFEEGTRLVALCTGQLDEAEQKVVMLQKTPSGELAERPFDPAK